MLTRNKLRKGEGMLKSFDPEVGSGRKRINMENEEACWEEEQNFRKVFYNMQRKWTNCFHSTRKPSCTRRKLQMIVDWNIMEMVENIPVPLCHQVIVLITIIVIPYIPLKNRSLN